MSGRRLPRRTVLTGGLAGLAAVALACSGKRRPDAGAPTAAPTAAPTGAPELAVSAVATRSSRSRPSATPAPQPPAYSTAVFKPATGYTSFIADERHLAWLAAAPDRSAVIAVADVPGTNERVVVRPLDPQVALGRPWLVGDWLAYAATQSSAGPGPWAVRAVNLLTGEDVLIDQDSAGWEGLSLASDGQTLAYTALRGPAERQQAELVTLDLTRGAAPRTVLALPPGRVLQRLAVSGVSAVAAETALDAAAASGAATPVRPTAGAGQASTGIVAISLATGERTPLPSGPATMPAVSGQWIAWVTLPAGDAPNALVLYDRASGSTSTVATAPRGTSLFNPSMTGPYLTWNRSDAAVIPLYDLHQRATFTLDQGVTGNVWANRGAIIWTWLDRSDNQYKLKLAQLQLQPQGGRTPRPGGLVA